MTSNALGKPRTGASLTARFWGVLFVGGCILVSSAAMAQEKVVTLSFTKEVLYNIARDNQGEMTREITDRLMGLTPSAIGIEILRSGGLVTLVYKVKVGTGLNVKFNFTIEKVYLYRMATSRTDINGMLEILKKSQEKEPLILDIAYRYDESYSIIDVTLDLRPFLKGRAGRVKDAAAVAPPPVPVTLPKTPPQEKAAPPPPAKTAAPKEIQAPRSAAAKKDVPKKAAAKKKPEEKKAPKPAARKATYLSARSPGDLPPPAVDGLASDPAWKKAAPFTFNVRGASGDFKVTASALLKDDMIYFLFQWPDKDSNTEHHPWVWSEEDEEYVAGKQAEDALAVQFAVDGSFGDCMLSGKNAFSDLWSWRAGRTDPAGFAEDGSLTVSAKRIPKANFYQAKNKKTLWVKERKDPGTGPYGLQVAGTFQGRKVARYVSRAPSGSAADVSAKGTWEKGVWTVEYARKLVTDDKQDVIFQKKKDLVFSVAVFNKRERSEHSASRELRLRVE